MGNDIRLPFEQRTEPSALKPEVEMKAKESLVQAIKSKKDEIENLKHQIAQIDFNINQIRLNKEYYNKLIVESVKRLEILQTEIVNANLGLDNYVYQSQNYLGQLQQLEISEVETDDDDTNYSTSNINHLKAKRDNLTKAIEANDSAINYKWDEFLECKVEVD